MRQDLLLEKTLPLNDDRNICLVTLVMYGEVLFFNKDEVIIYCVH